jgi:hypothetical protein
MNLDVITLMLAQMWIFLQISYNWSFDNFILLEISVQFNDEKLMIS